MIIREDFNAKIAEQEGIIWNEDEKEKEEEKDI